MPTEPFDDITVAQLLNYMYALRDACQTEMAKAVWQHDIDAIIHNASYARGLKIS